MALNLQRYEVIAHVLRSRKRVLATKTCRQKRLRWFGNVVVDGRVVMGNEATMQQLCTHGTMWFNSDVFFQLSSYCAN
jgi:hypothetical protein